MAAERAILALLEQRGPGKTICPSAAARVDRYYGGSLDEATKQGLRSLG
jgi:hypothetical protein